MEPKFSRRQLVASAVAVTGMSVAAGAARPAVAEERSESEPFGYCFNTSCIRGQKLGLVEEIEIAAQAGYQAVEPWIRKIDEYVEGGGSLEDLGKRIADLGLSVESAIGFCDWIVDDPVRRSKGLEEARRSMALLRRIGGKRIAAPPTGATREGNVELLAAADRYRALLEVGDEMGVVPQVELWGFSKTLSRLGEVVLVAVESGHPNACLLPDVYHIYKGGSDFSGFGLLNGAAIHVFHVNDYPADPPREEIKDSYRVHPGDGVAPLTSLFQMLLETGFRGMLSLELFNREYWKQDPLTIARTGLEKTRAAVRASFE